MGIRVLRGLFVIPSAKPDFGAVMSLASANAEVVRGRLNTGGEKNGRALGTLGPGYGHCANSLRHPSTSCDSRVDRQFASRGLNAAAFSSFLSLFFLVPASSCFLVGSRGQRSSASRASDGDVVRVGVSRRCHARHSRKRPP